MGATVVSVPAGLQFRILGPLEVRRGGKLIPITAPRRRALLGLLLLRANQIVSFDELVDELWNGRPPRTANASLHNQVAALRKVVGAETIATHPSGYRLEVAPEQLDLMRFESLVAESRSADPSVRAAKLREALAEWRGPPLAEVPALQIETVRLEELRLVAVEELIESELALGLDAELVPELESLVERHPLRERLWGHLMVALYRSGRQAEALATYRQRPRDVRRGARNQAGPCAQAVAARSSRPGSAARRAERRRPGRTPRTDRPTPADAGRTEPRPSDIRVRRCAVAARERERSEAALERAAQVAAAAGDGGLEELVRLRLSWQELFTRRGNPTAHLARARRARRVFEESNDSSSLAKALQHEGLMLRDLGQATDAATAFQGAAELAQEVGDASQESVCRDQMCLALALGPMPVEQVIERCDAESEIVKRLGRSPICGWWALGLLYAQRGDTAGGARVLRLRAGSKPGRGALEPDGAHVLLPIVALRADWRSGQARNASCGAPSSNSRRSRIEACSSLSRDAWHERWSRQGKLEEAEQLSSWASRAGDPDDFHEQVAWRQGMALVDARLGRHAQARKVAREAVDLARRSDWLNLQAETLEDLAEVEASAEDTEAACSALEDASALYERKGNRVARERALRTLEDMRA